MLSMTSGRNKEKEERDNCIDKAREIASSPACVHPGLGCSKPLLDGLILGWNSHNNVFSPMGEEKEVS